jgi:hypothetical protein
MKDDAPKTIRVGTAEAVPGSVLWVNGAVLTAPADGMIFSLRCFPIVNSGGWCRFYKWVEALRT